MKITLVRHGQTEEDFLRKIQGQRNELMNDTGRRQCQRLKIELKDKHYDYCYMSPLVRCVETALILIGDRVEMIPDKRLIARDMGELEGKPVDEYNAFRFWNYDLNWNKFGVEPVKDVFSRCEEFLKYITDKHKDKDILIVTHEAPYRAFRYLLKNEKLEGSLLDGNIDNCKYEEFEI